ncbi:MAG TPA: Gfo/Idh/MocA family oxidoreductase [Gemmatimonadales bacterium]
MPPLRGVVFGMGGVARQSHLPALRALVGEGLPLEVIAGVDPRHGGTTLDGIPVLTTRAELARIEPIDFIDICTPTASHLELVLWGLERGYHVACEKPVAMSGEQAAAIMAAARRARRVVFPCHQHRFNPAWTQLRSWVETGAIGRWHLAEFQVYRPRADHGSTGAAVPWRGQEAVSLGGVLLDHGTHLLYLLMDVAGTPTALQAWSARLRHTGYDVEDTVQLMLEFGDRAATLFLTWAGAARENRIRFIGDRGQAEWRAGELMLESADRREVLDFTAALDKRAYTDWFAALFRSFLAAAASNDGAAGLADVNRVARVLALAYRSAAEGRRLLLEPQA